MKTQYRRSKGCGSHGNGNFLFFFPFVLLGFFFLSRGESNFPYWLLGIIIFIPLMARSSSKRGRHARNRVRFTNNLPKQYPVDNQWNQGSQFCSNCGTQHKLEDTFCSTCGYNLNE